MDESLESFVIFGLNKDSSLSEAKKAYYNLALLVHPDRNSCPDKKTAQLEMKAVTDMYNIIKKHIQNRELNKKYKDCSDLQDAHDDELKNLDEFNKEMPSFMDIFMETHEDMKKFNEKFENKISNEEDYTLNTQTGYSLLGSEYIDKDFKIEYNPTIDNDLDLSKLEYSTNNEIVSIDNLAANQRHPIAQMLLAMAIAEDQPEKSLELIMASIKTIGRLAVIQALAASGSEEMQYTLGVLNFEGNDDLEVNKDEKEAVHWFQLAANQGNENAQYMLGYCLYHGQGCDENEDERGGDKNGRR